MARGLENSPGNLAQPPFLFLPGPVFPLTPPAHKIRMRPLLGTFIQGHLVPCPWITFCDITHVIPSQLSDTSHWPGSLEPQRMGQSLPLSWAKHCSNKQREPASLPSPWMCSQPRSPSPGWNFQIIQHILAPGSEMQDTAPYILVLSLGLPRTHRNVRNGDATAQACVPLLLADTFHSFIQHIFSEHLLYASTIPDRDGDTSSD